MTDAGAKALAVVSASVFFGALGVLGLFDAYRLASGAGPDPGALFLVSAAALAASAGSLFLPWQRWSRPATLGLAVYALALLMVADRWSGRRLTDLPAATYPAYLIAITVWLGLTQPRAVALGFTACIGAVLAYVSMHNVGTALPLGSLVITLPLGAALGEGAAWAMNQLRTLRRREARQLEDLGAVSLALERLTGPESVDEAARLLADGAQAVFRGAATAALVISADDQRTRVTLGGPHEGGELVLYRLLSTALELEDGPQLTDLHDHRYLLIPLVGPTRITGAVVVAGPDLRSTAFVEPLAVIFGRQAGNALEQSQVIELLDRDARRDSLTGMGNRRHAAALMEGLLRGDAVLLIDVDRFKDVNDNDGHRAGDELLRDLAQYLQSFVRDGDDLARFGGDEFIVVARQAGDDALAAANRLLQGWRTLQPAITLSIGLAVHPNSEVGWETLDRADAALYDAKRRGRDQIAVHRPDISLR